MYRRLTALTLSLALLLSGCSGLLERSQRTVNPHVEQAASEGDPSVLRAENYQSLVSAVLHFVSEGMERGKVRLYKYTGNIGDDLASACDEVMLEDPLGAYALEDIDWNYNRIVSYYECSFQFTYRRTAEQIQSVRSVNGVTAIRNALEEAMAAGQTEAVLRVSSYYAGEAWIGQLFGEAEAPDADDPAENLLRRRRLGFYQRCGFRILDYQCGLFGVRFHGLYRGPLQDDAQVLAMHRKVYADYFPADYMGRLIQIPLLPGEALPPAAGWVEDFDLPGGGEQDVRP